LLQLATRDVARRSTYQERAFRYTQLAKARSLSEAMNLSDALLQCVDGDLRDRLRQSQRAIAEARAAIEYPSEPASVGDDSSGWTVLQEAEARHKSLIDQVAQLHPELVALLSPGTFMAADVCRWLPRPADGESSSAVLEFLLTQDALCVFLLGPRAGSPLRCFRIAGFGCARWAAEFGAGSSRSTGLRIGVIVEPSVWEPVGALGTGRRAQADLRIQAGRREGWPRRPGWPGARGVGRRPSRSRRSRDADRRSVPVERGERHGTALAEPPPRAPRRAVGRAALARAPGSREPTGSATYRDRPARSAGDASSRRANHRDGSGRIAAPARNPVDD
jgi:hypothetical protein